MPTEDHNSSDRSHQGLPQGGVELSLDELAKGLATGTLSRGKALRLMGAALVGGTLASFPGVALAAKGGKSSCAKFCQSLFGANTPQEAQCVSQGTKGQGPCFTCTTQTGCGPNFTKPTCTVTGQSYNCATCRCECPSGQEVCGGSCATTCCTPNGRTCTTDGDCCSGICNSDTCGGCRSDGGSCDFDGECCNGNCVDGTCTSTPTCIPDNADIRCTTNTACCNGNCFLHFCSPRDRIACGCQSGSTTTCTSIDCSDAPAVEQFCTNRCLERVGSPYIPGNVTCTPNGCAG
jgi:hypothetical protein